MLSTQLLLPWAAATLTPLAGQALRGAGQGLSFLQQLLEGPNGPGSGQEANHGEAELLAGPPGLSSPAGQAHLAKQADRELQAFLTRFTTALHALGLDTSSPIELKAGGRGEVQVAGNHPQRAAIEELFRSDPALFTAFQRALSAATAYYRASEPLVDPRSELRLRAGQGQGSFHLV